MIDDLTECVADQHAAAESRNHAATFGAIDEFHQRMIGHSKNSALRLLVGSSSELSVSSYPKLLLGRPNQKAIWTRTEESVAAHEQVLGAGRNILAQSTCRRPPTFW